MDTLIVDYLQFYIQVGGGSDQKCNGATSRQESVMLQYSNNGGIQWYMLKELQGLEYFHPKYVKYITTSVIFKVDF